MIITQPNWIQLFGHYINMNQITHINMCVYGRDCGAIYEHKDEKFLVIKLSCGQSYRVAHKSGDIEDVMNKLGFTLKSVEVN